MAGGVIGEMASQCGGMKAKRKSSLKKSAAHGQKYWAPEVRGAEELTVQVEAHERLRGGGGGGGGGWGKQRVMLSGEGEAHGMVFLAVKCANARSGVGGLERGRRLQIRTCTKSMRQKPGEGRWI